MHTPPYQHDFFTDWMELMKGKLDRYEVARNEYTADYKMPPRNVMFYREVVLPFAENTLIMDNIAASEGLRYNSCGCQNKLIIRCFIDGNEMRAEYPDLSASKQMNCCDKGEIISYPKNFPYLVRSKKSTYTLEASINNKVVKGDIEICLPSEHAFYSILENVIRNSAKHNKEELKDKNLEICISIFDNGNSDLYEVNVYDNVSAMSVNKLCKLIKGKRQSLLDESYQMRRENLGIADMKINAHLLRSSQDLSDELLEDHLEIVLLQSNRNKDEVMDCKCDQKSIFSHREGETKDKREDLKEAIEEFINDKSIAPQHNDEEPRYRFGYRFHLAKSKKVCWIGQGQDNSEQLEKKGIYLFDSWEAFQDQKNGSLAAFQFAIIESEMMNDWKVDKNTTEEESKSELEDKLEELLLQLPFRVLFNSTNGLSSESLLQEFIENGRIQQVAEPIRPINDIQNGDWDFELLKTCWENWLKRWVKKNEKIKLILCFDSENGEHSGDQKYHEEWKKIVPNRNLKLSDGITFQLLTSGGTEKEDVEQTTRVVLYDHHGGGLDQIKHVFSLSKDFYQIIEKSSEDYVPIYYPPQDENRKKLFCFELIEAGLVNIIVVDERLCVQMFDVVTDKKFTKVQSCLNHCADLVTKGQLASWAKLWLSNKFERNKFLEGDSEYISCNIINSHADLNYWECDVNNIDIDALIVHRTYLSDENITPGSKVEEEYLPQYLSKLRKSIPFVVVISGGGAPHGMRGNFKFKPYGTYQNYFSNSFSKFSITRVTFS